MAPQSLPQTAPNPTPDLEALYEIGRILATGPDLALSLGPALQCLQNRLGAREILLLLQSDPGVWQCHGTALPTTAAPDLGAPPEDWCQRLAGQLSGPSLQGPERVTRALPVGDARPPEGWLLARFDRPPEAESALLGLTAGLVAQQLAARAHPGEGDGRARSLRVRRQIAAWEQLEGLVGTSRAMQEVFADLLRIAPKAGPVLLEGEPGTGKARTAQALHRLSPRQAGPFVAVDCHDMPEEVLLRRLFGPGDGGETGAWRRALGGSLYLDGIGEVGPTLQARLLNLLQVQEAAQGTPEEDVRLLVATHRNLESLVVSARFRADLYYRLHGEALRLPPLRERREDIPALAAQLLKRLSQNRPQPLTLAPGALEALYRCQWPGNVAGLENCLAQAAAQTPGPLIPNLPCGTAHCQAAGPKGLTPDPGHSFAPSPLPPAPLALDPAPFPPTLPAPAPAKGKGDLIDRQSVLWALEKCGWVQAKAARLLHISARQMWYAVHKYGIQLKKL